MDTFKNYGDRDFLNYGILVSEQSDSEFRILMCRPYDEVDPNDGQIHYQFADMTVDINDSWIKEDRVAKYAGVDKAKDPIRFAVACVEYYGPENFGADGYSYQYDWRDCTKEEVLKQLGGYTFDWDGMTFEGLPYDLTDLSGTEYVEWLPVFVQDALADMVDKACATDAAKRDEWLQGLGDRHLDELNEIIDWRSYTDHMTLSGMRTMDAHNLGE